MLFQNALNLEIVDRFPRGTRDFTLLQSAQTGSENHNASSEVERPGREADHSLPSSAEFMRVKLYIYFPVRCHGHRWQ
jgi:hypothetical protein